MKPLSIAAYFDGRLGHEKQTQGILNALSELTPIDVKIFHVSPSPLAYLKNWIQYLFPLVGKNLQGSYMAAPVDLIIGTGAHTHTPMLTRRKLQCKLSGGQVRVVTCMSPDIQLRYHFDLCFIPMHDNPAVEANIFVTQGPPNTVKFAGGQQSDRSLILIGGVDRKSHVWNSDETVSQIMAIMEKDRFIQWTVSSSPRTPEEMCIKLERLTGPMQNVNFYRSEDTPTGWVEEQYGVNSTVWVTADSVSMVYEALTAGCSVGILPVQWLKDENKFNRSLDYLIGKKMIADFDSWQSGQELPAQRTQLLDVSFKCAREILNRWWPDRLQ
jgi:mitochondrial fission protein ELM1